MSALLLAAAETRRSTSTSQTRIVAAVLAIAFMLMILELIRRDRLQERYSVDLVRRRPGDARRRRLPRPARVRRRR